MEIITEEEIKKRLKSSKKKNLFSKEEQVFIRNKKESDWKSKTIAENCRRYFQNNPPVYENKDKKYTFEYIDEIIQDIMIEFGPDGHTDGSGVITHFILALLQKDEDRWIEAYEKRVEERDEERRRWREKFLKVKE